ncbi:related to CNS1-cyclophilin seven suppressor [Serendipita indica DSM 11827]|uniref:Related to CNS1-cyclophilin seven suppressor n=1 Tax=Serendipita indica (strain DSM 11827) TaxID=1109443 RepID=G4T8Z2_SERID|nr:related to CNS1-cyclophilin seven suppressor [Serendipita indica DSM 11827]
MATFPKQAEYDVQQKLKEMDSVPLFMKTLPSDGEEAGEALEALQALVHDGTPDGSTKEEIATNFKTQGNDYFKAERYREALGFYTQAIDAKPTDSDLLQSLLLNRAACNLELSNKSLKALYRSALALIALERPEEAIDCCNRALVADAQNSSILNALSKAKALKERQEAREKAKQEAAAAAKAREMKIQAALRFNQARSILVLPLAPGQPSLEHHPTLSNDDPPRLSVPMLFLYPQYSQSDIISSFHEDTRFTDHLEVMFPPEGTRPGWDLQGDYVLSNLVLYASTKRKRLLKIGKKTTLADLCNNAAAKTGEPVDGLEMVDGHLSVVVLPKGTVEKDWIDKFKIQRGG